MGWHEGRRILRVGRWIVPTCSTLRGLALIVTPHVIRPSSAKRSQAGLNSLITFLVGTDNLKNTLAVFSSNGVLAIFALTLFALILPRAAVGQEHPESRAGSDALRIFLDCGSCDFDYLRREIPFVNYVRDRKEADVHILVTTQPTGSGGTEYVFKFIGLDRFANVDDELKYVARQTLTGDERRRGYTELLKLGLVRYVTSTAMADRLRLVYRPDAAAAPLPAALDDPWNFWSFRVRGSGSVTGEVSTRSRNLSTSVAANRTTSDWKVNLTGNLNFHEDQFTLSDGGTVTDVSHDHSLGGIVVKSLQEHWAVAGRGRVASVTFLNQQRASRLGAGIEYSVFPYVESSRRELTLQLTANVNRFKYFEPTIYGRLDETAADAVLLGAFNVRQPWGSSGLSLETATFFHDFGRHRFVANGAVDVRLFRGFSLSMGGSASRINDQLYLAAGDASDEEILLQRRQLATTYRYRFSAGISYTFGSIFNNVVNTRF
jgi:hypothetical protein